MTEIKSWAELAPQLVNVAAGRLAADLVVKNGAWVNVHSGEIIHGTDLAIFGGRFAYCGPDASHCIGESTEVVDAAGKYLVPGLCDAHMHIESGMLNVTQFSRAVIPHGTTSMFVDPHEIANVCGTKGVDLMLENAVQSVFKFCFGAPSCVPATQFETSGSQIDSNTNFFRHYCR